jgi:hypothetical protein
MMDDERWMMDDERTPDGIRETDVAELPSQCDNGKPATQSQRGNNDFRNIFYSFISLQ